VSAPNVTSDSLKVICQIVLLVAALVACGPADPPLTATNILITAPLPGNEFSAAYLSLHNESGETITVHRISSPQFAQVEIHETVVSDGVVRMRRLGSVSIDAGGSVILETGAKHLMLIDPITRLLPGQNVSLHIEYDDEGTLIINAPLQVRN
jgi:copper(I)-binding protein